MLVQLAAKQMPPSAHLMPCCLCWGGLGGRAQGRRPHCWRRSLGGRPRQPRSQLCRAQMRWGGQPLARQRRALPAAQRRQTAAHAGARQAAGAGGPSWAVAAELPAHPQVPQCRLLAVPHCLPLRQPQARWAAECGRAAALHQAAEAGHPHAPRFELAAVAACCHRRLPLPHAGRRRQP